jgi:hypothetical protein
LCPHRGATAKAGTSEQRQFSPVSFNPRIALPHAARRCDEEERQMAKHGSRSKSENRTPVNAKAALKSGLSRRALLLGLTVVGSGGALAWSMLASTQPAKADTITVWKSPTCSCCGGWVAYMRSKGYQVAVNLVDDPDAIKASFGVPAAVYSCHTAKIGDYLVEGHVPESAVAKLLAERPDLKGIALPGMPEGAPGMGGIPGIYGVVGFATNGQIRRFAQVGV